MLLLMSNLSLFAQSNTKNSVEIPRSQVPELYKIAKQNTFLKNIITKQDAELDKTLKIVADQSLTIAKYQDLVSLKDQVIANEREQTGLMIKSKDVEISRLNELAKIQEKVTKVEKRKSWWNGAKVGGITVGILGGVTAAFLLTR